MLSKLYNSEYGTDSTSTIPPPLSPGSRNPNSIHFAFQNLENAKRESKRTGKPIFCRRIGEKYDDSAVPNSLTHPLVVEAAETLFVSLTLESDLDVPTVCASVGILDKDGKRIFPEIYGNQLTENSISLLVDMMVASLIKCKRIPPKYLCLLDEEESGKLEILPSGESKTLERVCIFGVSNIHAAEANIAASIGVLDIQAGLHVGRQVLKATYASKVTSFETIVNDAIKKNLVTTIYYQTHGEEMVARRVNNESTSYRALDKMRDLGVEKIEEVASINKIIDGRSGIRKTALRYVPMTNLQKIRTNRLVFQGYFNEATHLLSPRQAEIMMKSFSNVKTRVDAVDLSLREVWKG
jgi:hypothetical protein